MIVSGYPIGQSQYNNQQPQQAKISFKQVTPEHFFIQMQEFKKDSRWGDFMVDLVNSVKKNILNSETNFKTTLYDMGKKYHKFKQKHDRIVFKEEHPKAKGFPLYSLLFSSHGAKKHFYNQDLMGHATPQAKYGEYYPLFKDKLDANENSLKSRRKISFKLFNARGLKPQIKKFNLRTWQAQEKFGDKDLILTQIAYLTPKPKESVIFFIHPPLKSRKTLMKDAQKMFESLKLYKDKELTEEDISSIYEKVGEIHWDIAQAMPFNRGSASMADAFTKSVFESLNIQTAPWEKRHAPDLEAFMTPMEEYSKKYRTFFQD